MTGRANRWKTEPHVRFGDPCYRCGIPMTPASRWYNSLTIPDGMRAHGGLGLCSSCVKKYRRGEWTPEDDE